VEELVQREMSGLDAAHSHRFRDLPVSLAAEEVLSALAASL